jgi:hypothetical protein
MTPPGSSPVVGPAGKDGDVADRRSTRTSGRAAR